IPLQRRYWPRKKQRSVSQAGRKKRCPGLAGKTNSRGRNTRKRKTKLSPAVIASVTRFMGAILNLWGSYRITDGRSRRSIFLGFGCAKSARKDDGFRAGHEGRGRFGCLSRRRSPDGSRCNLFLLCIRLRRLGIAGRSQAGDQSLEGGWKRRFRSAN